MPALPRGASIPWCAPCERPHTSREDRGDILGSGEQMQTNVVEVMLTQKNWLKHETESIQYWEEQTMYIIYIYI